MRHGAALLPGDILRTFGWCTGQVKALPLCGSPPPRHIFPYIVFLFQAYWGDSCRPTSLTGGTKCLTGGTILLSHAPVKYSKYALPPALKYE